MLNVVVICAQYNPECHFAECHSTDCHGAITKVIISRRVVTSRRGGGEKIHFGW
jgi:hypothetical protein